MNSQEKDNKSNVSVVSQYIKDLSFKNLRVLDFDRDNHNHSKPHLDVGLDLNIKRISQKQYFEVEIVINVKAVNLDKLLFSINLKYAGIFSLVNTSPEEIQLLLAVKCPAIIFPFARRIIADLTQESGFQPLMIDPIDFYDLYKNNTKKKL